MSREKIDPTRVDVYLNRLQDAIKSTPLTAKVLANIDKWPLLLIRRNQLQNNLPNVLIAGSFHGEEPAGCWGILHFLENIDLKVFDAVNISFLPLVNPTGVRQGRRYNDWGENPNSGFCHQERNENKQVSREGLVLMNNLSLILTLASEAFVSLHEDIDMKQFYLYTFEQRLNPGPFSLMLRSVESRFFDSVEDGKSDEIGPVENGIIFNFCDGSFEDMLSHKGVPLTACTETPGKLEFDLRVEANAAIIMETINFFTNSQSLE